MSWSVTLIGTPDKIVAALEAESGKQSGQCKIEFDDALPGLKTIVLQNFDKRDGAKQRVLKLRANGSGQSKQVSGPNGSSIEQVQRNCSVSLEDVGELLT